MNQHVRVSAILAMLFPYVDVDKDILEAKAKIGTNVHNAILQDCRDDFVVLECDRARAYFNSYKMMYPKIPPIKQIQRLYCDKLMITGECDGLLQGNGPDMLIDWKCSASPHIQQWKMQAHFYWYLLKENGYSISERMMWINLRHHKRIKYKSDGYNELIYDPVEPIVFNFTFEQEVLDKCIEAAIRYWDLKSDAKCLA